MRKKKQGGEGRKDPPSSPTIKSIAVAVRANKLTAAVVTNNVHLIFDNDPREKLREKSPDSISRELCLFQMTSTGNKGRLQSDIVTI
jgi:hypothetical protein